MKSHNERKTTLVDFMRSIKFPSHHNGHSSEATKQFAAFNQRVRVENAATVEDHQLIRSAN